MFKTILQGALNHHLCYESHGKKGSLPKTVETAMDENR